MVLKRRGDFEKSIQTLIPVKVNGIKEVVLEVKTDPHDPTKKLIKTKKFKFSDDKLLTVAQFKELLA